VKKEKDRLIQHYDTILKESALLAAFAGILFGFLLQISINTPRYFTYFDKAILLVALFSITISASLFASLPVRELSYISVLSLLNYCLQDDNFG